MKKTLHFLFLTLCIVQFSNGQNWTVYDGSAAPAENVDPNWNASNGSEGTWTVEADPDITGNDLVIHESLGSGGGMFKTDDFDPIPTSFTTAFRVKLKDPAATGVAEMDLHVNGIRDQLIVYADNRIKLTRSNMEIDLSGTLDVTEWNIFRMTVDASSGTQGTVTIYLNEDPAPVLTATSTTTTGSKYLRYGDGQSSVTYSAYIDFIIWDGSGAYTPSGSAIPANLLPTEKGPEATWTIYSGDLAPADNVDPNWNASNGSEGTWVVEADPDISGNNVVVHESLGAGNGMYKTDDFDPVPSKITTVFRVKLKDPSATGVAEMDLHVNGIRDQLIVYADNRVKLTRSNTEVDLSGTLDVSEWNVFRMTVDASSGTQGTVTIYLNEDPAPILTATSTTTTGSKYLRYGDGQSSVTYSAYIDFIIYDLGGAFSPSETEVPVGMIPGIREGEWVSYSGDSAPADNTDPNWNASNGSEGTWTVEADPDVSGNNLVVHESLGSGSGMYKTDDFDPVPTAFTTVFRVKLKDPSATGVAEMDLHINGIRDQLIIYADNRIKLTRSNMEVDLSGTLDVSEWNVFRMTVDASSGTQGTVTIYLNENPTAVLTATSTTTTGSKYLRFGDGQSSVTYSAYIDFINYDVSGAYSPTYTALPAGLVPPPRQGDWVLYTADFAPADNTELNWNASNGSEGTWTVEADADMAGNNLVVHESLGSGSGMYKTDDFDPVPTAFTTVFRVKLKDPSATGVAEMDLHINGIRDQLIVYADNRVKLTRSNMEVDLSGTLDVSEWNVFRMTVDASSGTQGTVTVYLNEDPTPVLTATSTTTTGSKYLRFGDGQSSVTYSAYIDFIVYDLSGAYSPTYVAIPDGLLPSDEVTVPEGDWTLYLADLAPADNTEVTWNASNGSEGTWIVEADPDADNNNIVAHESLGGDKGQYKTSDFDPIPTAFTSVFRTKLKDPTATGVFEMDLHINGMRDQLIVYSDNRLKLTRSNVEVDLTGTLDVTQWNVFRMTIDASSGTQGTVTVYLNEKPTPVMTAITTTTTGSKYLRFGDGQGSVTYSSYIDFIVWDLSGAYSPAETALPDGLIPTPKVGDWILYEADLAPVDNVDPAWNASNGSEGTWVVGADPDVSGNNIVTHESLGSGGGMYKTDNFDPVPAALTTAFRVKLKDPAAGGVAEMDLHVNGIRDQLIIYSDNRIKLTRSNMEVDLSGTLDVTEWNVFRMTVDASSGTQGTVTIYLNEEPMAVLTATSTTTTGSNYLRYGDGQSSVTYSAYIDFIVWDVSGAFSPAQRILPPGLIPGTDEDVEDLAQLSDLTVDGTTVAGFKGDKFEYTVSLPHDTNVTPTVTATPLYNGATAAVTDASALPGSTIVVVDGAGPATETYTITFEIEPDTDATLSAIMADSNTIANFVSTTTFYEYGVPVGTTVVPTITASTTDPNATYSVVDAAEIPGISVITVTAEDGASTTEYKVSIVIAYSKDATLSDLQMDGTTVNGFSPTVYSYDVVLDSYEVPGIIALATDEKAIPVVSYPVEIPGTATVEVTAEDGVTKQMYSIEFTTTAVLTGILDVLKVNLYPNPVVHELVVSSQGDFTHIQIINVNGQLLKEFENTRPGNDLRLDVSDLNKGLYVVLLKTRNQIVSRLKIIK